MISETEAKRELVELFNAIPLLNALPKDGKISIARAMMRHAQSGEHLKQIVQVFLETVLEWRNPIAELVRIAEATKHVERAPAGCANCRTVDPVTGGAAWLDFVDFFDGDKFLRTDRCQCVRGDWFRARKAAR